MRRAVERGVPPSRERFCVLTNEAPREFGWRFSALCDRRKWLCGHDGGGTIAQARSIVFHHAFYRRTVHPLQSHRASSTASETSHAAKSDHARRRLAREAKHRTAFADARGTHR